MGRVGTGIVFVVLVAIWVAYFVQYWSRRREHLATARSVEAFAEAMRVLERRPAVRAQTGHRLSSAYAMSPARVVSARPAPRPQVIAKPHPVTPTAQRGGAPTVSPPPSPRPARPSSARPSSARPSSRTSSGRRARGLALLASLTVTLVLVALAAFSLVPWWAPLVGVAAVGVSFVRLRAGVRAEAAARRAGPRRASGRAGRRPVRGPSTRPTASPAGARRAATATASAEPAHELASVSEPELVEAATVRAAVEEDPDGWHPVPVPPPTYTLKARAERPAPAPAASSPEVAIPAVHAAPAPVDPAFAVGDGAAERAAAYGT